MIPLSEYGFRSRAAFLRATNVPRATFDAIAGSDEWSVQKSVLLHPECPIDIRDRFASSPKWYKRLVAMFSNQAPPDYWRKAEGDQDRMIKKAYFSNLDFFGKKAV